MVGILPLPVVCTVWGGILLVPLTIGLEALRGSREWRAWSKRMDDVTVRDMLALRHIPNLHNHA